MVFVLAFLIMGLIMAGMAIGAMAGRGSLKGSCGGLSAVGIEGRCEICGDDPSLCKEEGESGGSSDASDARFYDASK
ncbi:(Na+)-NQR maturation NqrM [Congregibacter sp.]|uniref:(Na+)-NQR maturation NqrM n=1 Tax=Congregibacter sp. TaxID=2744308 RepID=UPI003F6D62EB